MKSHHNSSGHTTMIRVFFATCAMCFVLCLILVDWSRALASERCERCCNKTANTAANASRHEAWDDYWIAIGKCLNVSDADDRLECIEDARDELDDALEENDEQRDARGEICDELGQNRYDPDLDPTDFVDPSTIDAQTANPYLPLVPGTTWVYEGETDDGTERITVTVTGETKEIEYPEDSGSIFTCAVVSDVVELDGEVIEDTDDWFAQDNEGNVWYFGEISLEFEDGELVGVEGSWKSGADGAKPGIVMHGDPQPDGIYRQEYLLGEAEDVASVDSRGEETVTVPFGTYEDDVLVTEEWTPLEPDVTELKYYAPGVGMVLEVNEDDDERVELIDMTTP